MRRRHPLQSSPLPPAALSSFLPSGNGIGMRKGHRHRLVLSCQESLKCPVNEEGGITVSTRLGIRGGLDSTGLDLIINAVLSEDGKSEIRKQKEQINKFAMFLDCSCSRV